MLASWLRRSSVNDMLQLCCASQSVPGQVNMSAYCSSRVARLVLSACDVDVKDLAKRRKISLFSGVN